MLKTGMNLLLWADIVTEAHIPLIKELKSIGFDSVEIPLFDVENPKKYAWLGRLLKDEGLGATAVTVVGPDTNPIAPEASIRQAAVDHLKKVLDCGAEFGCETLVGPFHSAIGVFSGSFPTEKEFEHGVETMKKVAAEAATRKIQLGVEYLNRFEIYFLTTATQAARFVKAVDHPSCKMMYDTFHANIEEKSQAGAFNSCKDHVCHIHISENDRGIPGTGQVHWSEFWAALKASDYSGYLTIEAFGSALPNIAAATKIWRDIFPDSLALAREGLAFIKQNAGI